MKKLIRDKYAQTLTAEEVEQVTDKQELNKLYELKVREELQEIVDSGCKDVQEFGDLMEVVRAWAEQNGITGGELFSTIIQKEKERGRFSNTAISNIYPDHPSNQVYFNAKESVC
jgi:predicted house-cleaning noncanonical NTP pyrophosphatase (MazG superfamily)